MQFSPTQPATSNVPLSPSVDLPNQARDETSDVRQSRAERRQRRRERPERPAIVFPAPLGAQENRLVDLLPPPSTDLNILEEELSLIFPAGPSPLNPTNSRTAEQMINEARGLSNQRRVSITPPQSPTVEAISNETLMNSDEANDIELAIRRLLEAPQDYSTEKEKIQMERESLSLFLWRDSERALQLSLLMSEKFCEPRPDTIDEAVDLVLKLHEHVLRYKHTRQRLATTSEETVRKLVSFFAKQIEPLVDAENDLEEDEESSTVILKTQENTEQNKKIPLQSESSRDSNPPKKEKKTVRFKDDPVASDQHDNANEFLEPLRNRLQDFEEADEADEPANTGASGFSRGAIAFGAFGASSASAFRGFNFVPGFIGFNSLTSFSEPSGASGAFTSVNLPVYPSMSPDTDDEVYRTIIRSYRRSLSGF